MHKKRIIAIIPARGGSKRIPRKNLKKLQGKPLIAWSIKAALASKLIDKVFVSTDDREIARVSKKYGAVVPFLRPASLAKDRTPMTPVIQHAVSKLRVKPDIVVVIQPTSPLVKTIDIDRTIAKLLKEKVSSCVSVHKVKERPEWIFTKKNGKFIPYGKPSKARTQDLPELFCLNGAIYVSTLNTIITKKVLVDYRDLTCHIMPRSRGIDIDEPEDFEMAEMLLKRKSFQQ